MCETELQHAVNDWDQTLCNSLCWLFLHIEFVPTYVSSATQLILRWTCRETAVCNRPFAGQWKSLTPVVQFALSTEHPPTANSMGLSFAPGPEPFGICMLCCVPSHTHALSVMPLGWQGEHGGWLEKSSVLLVVLLAHQRGLCKGYDLLYRLAAGWSLRWFVTEVMYWRGVLICSSWGKALHSRAVLFSSHGKAETFALTLRASQSPWKQADFPPYLNKNQPLKSVKSSTNCFKSSLESTKI